MNVELVLIEADQSQCPMCGGDTATAHYEPHETSAGCDTSVIYCLKCGWEGDPE